LARTAVHATALTSAELDAVATPTRVVASHEVGRSLADALAVVGVDVDAHDSVPVPASARARALDYSSMTEGGRATVPRSQTVGWCNALRSLTHSARLTRLQHVFNVSIITSFHSFSSTAGLRNSGARGTG
jgi:hypothetical protein